MRFPLVRITVACAALLIPAAVRGQEGAWPAAMLELEKLALQSPRRNAAFAHLAHLAAESGQLDQWGARWESRARTVGGAAESLLLGWLEIEAGHAKEARVWFARAAELAPENPHALLAHAESLLRMGKADGEPLARRAAELFTDVADKAGALRLVAVVAQEKGEFAAAWVHLGKLEGEPLDAALRVALMPDFARAHLALGDWEKWAATLLESSGKSAADAAACAAACLALGDPATSHRVVAEALKRAPGDTVLGKLATAAAIAAGFGGDAAARIEASLGAQPSDDDLAEAINALATLGAPEHARRIFTRHAARLSPIAARWRQALPALWRLGGTEGLRDLLTPHAASGGWELQFVLCELALLEKDPATAERALWQVLSREFDGHELASSTRALARKAIFNPPDLLLVGQHLESRCYSSYGAAHTDMPVHSLTQARDIALRDLGRMASDAGGDALDKLAATLHERTAHWLPGERLLAFHFAGQPAGILEAAEAAAALPDPSPDLRECIRMAIVSIRRVPPLPAEFTAAANALKKRFPFAKIASREEAMPQSWRARLHACWQLLGAGKLNEADTAFAAALRDFAEGGTGPDASAWAAFHASLIHSVLPFQDKALKTEAAAQVLRWIGMQTPRRTDWPTAARPQVLWTKSSKQQVHAMFGGTGSSFVAESFGSEMQQTAVGGSVPADLFAPLVYFARCFGWLDQRALGKALDAKLRDLPEECVRTALLSRGVGAASALVNEDAAWFARLRESRDAQPAQIAAAISSLTSVRVGRAQSGDVAAELLKAAPAGTIGRAAWLAAALHIIAHSNGSSDPLRLAAELATLPAEADTRSTTDAAIELLLSKTRPDAADLRAAAGKLALAWFGTDGMEPLPAEWRTRLRILVNSAEIDAAAALAGKILAQPLELAARSPEMTGIRIEAIRALDVTGELPAWFSSLQKNASRDNPSDLRRLAQAAREILDVVKAPAPRPAEEERPRGGRRKSEQPGGLDASLLREARVAQFDAEVRLVHLEPEEIEHWMALWFSTDDRRAPGEKLGAKPVIENATLLRAARGGLPPVMAFPFAGDDPRNIVDLATRWPAPLAQEPIADTVEIASSLWHEGEKDAALGWLRKMSGTAPFFLIEALAVRGDSAGIVDALAAALLAAAQPPPRLGPGFGLGRRSDVFARERPLAPLLDEASALGLNAPLAAKLAADPTPTAAVLALLVRAREHDATAASAITTCLAGPLRPMLVEEFAWQLAGWPEGRDGAQAAMRALKHSRPFPGAENINMQSARYGWLAARCGMESEAYSWLNQASGMRTIPTAQQSEMLLTVAEGMWQLGDRSRARAVAGDLAKSFANGGREAGRITTRLRQLAVEDELELVHMLCDALSVTKPPADSGLSAAIADATRTVAIREGRIYELTPFAWVRARPVDGMGEFGWALGYSTRGHENEKVLRVPDIPRLKSLRDSRLEIFEGSTNERLTRRATIVDPPPVGRVPLSTKEPKPTTSALLSTGGGANLGPALRAIEGEDLLPAIGELPGTLLPALIWKKRADGPDGDAIFSSHRPSQGSTSGDLFHASLIELPAAAGKDIVISGWARHEKPNLMDGAAILVIHPRGDGSDRWVLQHTIPAAPLGGDWQRFESRIRAPQAEQAGRAAPMLALQLLPGCAYSGLRVTVPKESRDADLPR